MIGPYKTLVSQEGESTARLMWVIAAPWGANADQDVWTLLPPRRRAPSPAAQPLPGACRDKLALWAEEVSPVKVPAHSPLVLTYTQLLSVCRVGACGSRRSRTGVADQIRRLLDHLVANYVIRDDQRLIELDASPREPGEVIESDKRQVVRRETDRADELADAFGLGLTRAYAQRDTEPELWLDDRDAEENRTADALIGFLVSHDLAASRTEETEPDHYRYAICVDWAKLATVATEADVDLDRALGGNSG